MTTGGGFVGLATCRRVRWGRHSHLRQPQVPHRACLVSSKYTYLGTLSLPHLGSDVTGKQPLPSCFRLPGSRVSSLSRIPSNLEASSFSGSRDGRSLYDRVSVELVLGLSATGLPG